MLDGLLDGSLSFSDVERESLASKSIDTLKDAFSKQTGCTWEEAVKEVPQYANEKVLKKYKVTKGKAPPQEFKVQIPQTHSAGIFPTQHYQLYIFSIQMFCERVKAQKENIPSNIHHLSPSIIVAVEEQLLNVPFEAILFSDMLDVSI